MQLFLLVLLKASLVISERNITFVNVTNTQIGMINDTLDFICENSICGFNGGLQLFVQNQIQIPHVLAYYYYPDNSMNFLENFLVPEIIIHEFYHYFTLHGFDDTYREMFDLHDDLVNYESQFIGISDEHQYKPHWLENQQEFGATLFEIWFGTLDKLEAPSFDSTLNQTVYSTLSVNRESISTLSPKLYKLLSTYFPNNDICTSRFNHYSSCNNTIDNMLIISSFIQLSLMLCCICTQIQTKRQKYFGLLYTLILLISLILIYNSTFTRNKLYIYISILCINLVICICFALSCVSKSRHVESRV